MLRIKGRVIGDWRCAQKNKGRERKEKAFYIQSVHTSRDYIKLRFCFQITEQRAPQIAHLQIKRVRGGTFCPNVGCTHVLSEANNQRSIIVKGLQECTIITYELYCVVGLNQSSCWQRAKSSDQLGRLTHTYCSQTPAVSRPLADTHTHTHTHTELSVLVSYYCVHLDLFLCSVYQMGPRSPWRDNNCNAALYSVLSCLQSTSPEEY